MQFHYRQLGRLLTFNLNLCTWKYFELQNLQLNPFSDMVIIVYNVANYVIYYEFEDTTAKHTLNALDLPRLVTNNIVWVDRIEAVWQYFRNLTLKKDLGVDMWLNYVIFSCTNLSFSFIFSFRLRWHHSREVLTDHGQGLLQYCRETGQGGQLSLHHAQLVCYAWLFRERSHTFYLFIFHMYSITCAIITKNSTTTYKVTSI